MHPQADSRQPRCAATADIAVRSRRGGNAQKSSEASFRKQLAGISTGIIGLSASVLTAAG
jgi:hypothetical protein